MALAFVGGTGLYRLPELGEGRWEEVETPFGRVEVLRGRWEGKEVLFLPRHGQEHGWPPHRIPYRAQMAALKRCEATGILAASACGTLVPHLPPGTLVLLTDFLDLTNRPSTFFDGPPSPVVHVDMSVPYCPRLRRLALEAAEAVGVPLKEGAVYACTEGPRFESPAEIRALRNLGAEVVGMTNVPEVVLAREAEICYAAVGVVTNWAAGISRERLTHGEVEAMMAQRLSDLQRLFRECVRRYTPQDCPCRHALDEYRQRLQRPDFSLWDGGRE